MPGIIRAKAKRHKYGAAGTVLTPDGQLWYACDVLRFDSHKEARRWLTLVALEKAGQISNLERQVEYVVGTMGDRPVKYVADFRYVEDGRTVVEDCKGMRTRQYLAKVKAMAELHGVTVKET